MIMDRFHRNPAGDGLTVQPAFEAELPLDGVIFHVPHDSTDIPADVRNQFALDDQQLKNEILKMTDHFTARLFCSDIVPQNIVRAPVSRLVVDVERFVEDSAEPMAGKGMGGDLHANVRWDAASPADQSGRASASSRTVLHTSPPKLGTTGR